MHQLSINKLSQLLRLKLSNNMDYCQQTCEARRRDVLESLLFLSLNFFCTQKKIEIVCVILIMDYSTIVHRSSLKIYVEVTLINHSSP